MRLYYFELRIDSKLYDVKIVAASSPYDAWLSFKEMYGETWENEWEGARIDKWKLCAEFDVNSLVSNWHDCPFKF